MTNPIGLIVEASRAYEQVSRFASKLKNKEIQTGWHKVIDTKIFALHSLFNNGNVKASMKAIPRKRLHLGGTLHIDGKEPIVTKKL